MDLLDEDLVELHQVLESRGNVVGSHLTPDRPRTTTWRGHHLSYTALGAQLLYVCACLLSYMLTVCVCVCVSQKAYRHKDMLAWPTSWSSVRTHVMNYYVRDSWSTGHNSKNSLVKLAAYGMWKLAIMYEGNEKDSIEVNIDSVSKQFTMLLEQLRVEWIMFDKFYPSRKWSRIHVNISLTIMRFLLVNWL